MSCTELDRALHKQVLKREAWKEQEAREEKKKRDDETMLGFGATEMGHEELRKVIDSDRRMYYRTEDLNDKLYIHYKGWRVLQGLEGWTGLRALYAECNAFDRIQGLQNCRQLRSLFLSENCIRKIEGLDNCPDLWSLNLANNFIERIEGLSKLKNLNTLVISKNKLGLQGVDDLIELADTPINSLDIQDNKIWDPDCLPEVFARMENLRVLYLKGNPCSKKIPNYRKSITVYCPDLKYLDDRPVFPEDRRAAEAFNRGGLEEERAERRRIREENNAKHDANMKAFQAMIDRARSEKRERTAMRAEDKYTDETDPVESNEQRMQRMVDKWKEENADDLQDDAKERAKRCLQAESEQSTVPSDDTGLDGPLLPEGEESEPQRREADNDGPQETERQEEADEEAGAGDGKKEDKRKLVYEDIWDDLPASQGAPAAAAPAPRPAAFAPPPRRPQAATAAAAAEAAGASTSGSATGGGSSGSRGRPPADGDSFVASERFAGARPGYFFGRGAEGLGYYRDHAPGGFPSAAAAAGPGGGGGGSGGAADEGDGSGAPPGGGEIGQLGALLGASASAPRPGSGGGGDGGGGNENEALLRRSRDAAMQAAAEAGRAPAWYAKFAEIAGGGGKASSGGPPAPSAAGAGAGAGAAAAVPRAAARGEASAAPAGAPAAAAAAPNAEDPGAELDEMD